MWAECRKKYYSLNCPLRKKPLRYRVAFENTSLVNRYFPDLGIGIVDGGLVLCHRLFLAKGVRSCQTARILYHAIATGCNASASRQKEQHERWGTLEQGHYWIQAVCESITDMYCAFCYPTKYFLHLVRKSAHEIIAHLD